MDTSVTMEGSAEAARAAEEKQYTDKAVAFMLYTKAYQKKNSYKWRALHPDEVRKWSREYYHRMKLAKPERQAEFNRKCILKKKLALEASRVLNPPQVRVKPPFVKLCDEKLKLLGKKERQSEYNKRNYYRAKQALLDAKAMASPPPLEGI